VNARPVGSPDPAPAGEACPTFVKPPPPGNRGLCPNAPVPPGVPPEVAGGVPPPPRAPTARPQTSLGHPPHNNQGGGAKGLKARSIRWRGSQRWRCVLIAKSSGNFGTHGFPRPFPRLPMQCSRNLAKSLRMHALFRRQEMAGLSHQARFVSVRQNRQRRLAGSVFAAYDRQYSVAILSRWVLERFPQWFGLVTARRQVGKDARHYI